MHAFQHGAQALRAEIARQAAALRERRLWLTLAIFAALLLLVAQLPLSYRIAIGVDEGFGGDMPMIAGFHDSEQSASTQSAFRWTTEHSSIGLPGIGQRPLQATLRMLPVSQELAQHGPQSIELWGNGVLIARLPVRPTSGGLYLFVVPAPADGSGDHLLELRSATFTPSGDRRAIGTPVDRLDIQASGGPALPPWRHDLAWLGAALLGWLALRRIGFAPAGVQHALLVAVALASLAARLDPPRFAFGSSTALIIAALGWLLIVLLTAAPTTLLLAGAALVPLAAVLRAASLGKPIDTAGAVLAGASLALVLAGSLRPALASAYARIATPIPAAARRWLLLIALIVFASHYGGKIYPDSMWGDIGFHFNRYADVLRGMVLLLSRNRGVDFPYPPAFYLLLAPLSLTGLHPRVLLQLVGALLDAASPLLVYAIAASIAGRLPERAAPLQAGALPGSARLGLLAAGIYSFSAATLMTTWWNFSTHIFTQFAHLLLITALVILPIDTSRAGASRTAQRSIVIGLFLLQALVYLGHFGFWINMSLLSGLGLAALLARAFSRPASWPAFRRLLGTFVAAEAFAALFFYSAYAGLFITQIQATATSGLTGLANRQAADPAALWRTLWDAGFRIHFGFFPVPLAIGGLVLLWWNRQTYNSLAANTPPGSLAQPFAHAIVRVVALMAGTFLIALLFAELPFISGSTLSTRWLMFSAWAIAVGAALVAQLLWRYGRAGRWLVVIMGSYIFWVSASMWLGALAWRVRPPEPF